MNIVLDFIYSVGYYFRSNVTVTLKNFKNQTILVSSSLYTNKFLEKDYIFQFIDHGNTDYEGIEIIKDFKENGMKEKPRRAWIGNGEDDGQNICKSQENAPNLPGSNKLQIFIFLTSEELKYNEIVRKYWRLLDNPLILTLIFDRDLLDFFFSYNKKPDERTEDIFDSISLEISTRYPLFWPISAVTGSLLYYISITLAKSIITKYSRADPNLNDFNILRSKLKTYGDFKDSSNENIESSCVICFEDFEDDSIIRFLECKHHFHQDCIDKWLVSRQHFCPCCRSDVEIVLKNE